MVRFEGTERYTIVGQLGTGGMGCVYDAVDTTTGEAVALKTLRPKDAHSLVRFKREFRTIARFNHPNLVKLYELSTWENGIFFTMEKVVGFDLRTYLQTELSERTDDADTVEVNRRQQTNDSLQIFGVGDEDWSDLASAVEAPTLPSVDLPPGLAGGAAGPASNPFVDIFGGEEPKLARAGGIASGTNSVTIGAREPAPHPQCDTQRLRSCLTQILDALDYLHSYGIVHRDLKPDNILVTEGGVVKVVDFGIMKDLFEARTVTVTGGILGTLAYIPPESTTGDTIGAAADLYTLGCIIFEMLSGSPPFPGSSIRTLWRHQNEEAPLLSTRVLGAGDDFEELCRSLLAKDPADRFSIADIRAVLHLERRHEGKKPRLTTELTPIVMPGPDVFAETISKSLLAVSNGSAHLVVLAADPGKKLQEVLGRVVTILAPERFQIFRGECASDEDLYYRALDAIIDDLALSVARLPRNGLRRLEEAVAQCTLIFPAFRLVYERRSEVLGPAPRMTDFSNSQLLDVSGRYDRRGVLEALGLLLTEVTRENPALFVIDNLADADQASFDLLDELLEHPIGRVGILCLVRPEQMFGVEAVREFLSAMHHRETVDTFILA